MESLVENYGYLAILIGTSLEGETILVLGGLAAHQGYLTLPGVILAAFAGSLCGDQLSFYLGRRHSQFIINRRPSWKARIDKAQKLMGRFQKPLILVFRFLYGLRTVMPFMIGMSRVPTSQFIAFNAAGALVWAILVGIGGYAFGHAIEIIVGDIKHYELRVFAAIVVTGLLIWIFYLKRRRITFRLETPDATKVSIVRGFNQWDETRHQMRKTESGAWKKTVVIPPGHYEYKFLKDEKWHKPVAIKRSLIQPIVEIPRRLIAGS